jgi:hypothetical protein
MKFLDNLSKRLNTQQKIILVIIVPAILVTITIPIAQEVPNEFEFPIWSIYLAIIGYFAYKLFGNTDKK